MLQAHFLGHMEIEDMSTRFSRDIETMKKTRQNDENKQIIDLKGKIEIEIEGKNSSKR